MVNWLTKFLSSFSYFFFVAVVVAQVECILIEQCVNVVAVHIRTQLRIQFYTSIWGQQQQQQRAV